MPKESAAGERRVALVPEIVGKLVPGGFEVLVERGAGEAGSFPDADYEEAGARIVTDAWSEADAVVKVQKPSAEEVPRLREGQVLIGFLQPLTDAEGIQRLAERGVVAFAMEAIPRITRAQPMDALSSQATVSGYKATLLAAERLPRFFPMLMTAAGTVAPAKVLVLGAGVAGLQAVATSRRLGAVDRVRRRLVVREQIRARANWLTWMSARRRSEHSQLLPSSTRQEESRSGRRVRRRRHDGAGSPAARPMADPGRRCPRDATRLGDRRPAAEAGGNCELIEPGEETVREGVTTVGFTNLPSSMPFHASQLYARNVSALLHHLRWRALTLDWDDEITAGACVAGKQEVAA